MIIRRGGIGLVSVAVDIVVVVVIVDHPESHILPYISVNIKARLLTFEF